MKTAATSAELTFWIENLTNHIANEKLKLENDNFSWIVKKEIKERLVLSERRLMYHKADLAAKK